MAQPSPGGPCRKCPGPAAHASAARLTQTTPTAVHSALDSRAESTHTDTMPVTAIEAASAAATT
nr:hypothetical protein MFLOJ_07680 [Mycobacterium florentinum]